MATDIQTQLPIKITDNSFTVGITSASRLMVDGSGVTNPVSGTVTVVPSGTQTVAPSGTFTVSQIFLATADYDTGAGTVTQVMMGIALPGSGGPVAGGTATNPVRIDPTGTTTQPVSGTVTCVPSGTQTVAGTVTCVPSGTQTVTGTVVVSNAGETTSGVVVTYGTVTDVGHNSTGTVSYTVTGGTTLYLKGVFASSSGAPAKVVIDYGAGPTVLAVGFYSTARPFLDFQFYQPPAISAGTVVRVKITNNGGAAQDIYATIMGHEI